MIYLIGGAARCGKSTLARKLLNKLPSAYLLSGDSMRQAIKPHLPPKLHMGFDTNEPSQYIDFYSQHSDYAIDEMINQGEAVWQYIERYASSLQQEGAANIIVDGIDIWPHLVATTPLECRSVFLVDSSADQWQRVIKHRDQHDWMASRGLSTEQIKAWATYSAVRSDRIVKLCQQHELPCIDISDVGYESAQDQAESILAS